MKRYAAILLSILFVFASFGNVFAGNANDTERYRLIDNTLYKNPCKFLNKENKLFSSMMNNSEIGKDIDIKYLEIINDGSILNYSFEPGETLTGWWTYDMDGDGNNWTADEWGASYCYDGTYAAVSRSWTNTTGALSANNWYMTPEFVPASTSKLSFYTRSLQAKYADPIQVLIAVKGSGAYNSAHTAVVESKWTTIIANQTINTEVYQQFSYDLSSYAGQTVTVAFRHQASDMNGIMIDLVQVGVGTEASPETGIALDQTTLALEVGAGAQLTATITPADAYFQDVTWSTSDATVAVVNKTGGVIGLAAGTATITATSHNGFTATCAVTVTGDALDDEMVAYGVGDTTWFNIDTYGALEAIQVDADSSFIVRGEYNPLDGLVYGYVNENSAYKFCSFDPENGYARTVIATVSAMPMWMAYDYDADIMCGCWWKDDSEMYTNVEIAVLDLTTGLEGEVLADTFTSTYEHEGETNQYNCMPMFGTYAGGGYFIAYDYKYKSILAYDCGSKEFDVFFVVSDVADQLGTEPQTYVQKMWYNPIDGMLYWASVFDTLDYVVVDVANGIMAKAGSNADEITVLFSYWQSYVKVTFVGVYNDVVLVKKGHDIVLPVFDGEGIHYTFTLNGEPWNGTNITEDITVEVGFDVNAYNVIFIDSMTDEIISEQQITHGEAASAPDAPEHIGYVFAGWDKDFSCVKSDMEINAVYDPVFVTVTYTGAYTNTQSVQYGYDAVLPVFEGEGIHYTFTVNGEPWDGTNITEDVTVFVGLDINTYTVTFIDSLTGELISEQEIRHGEPAEEPEIPEHFTYAFTGWDADFSCIKDDLTVNALYTRVECVISFYDSMTGELIADVVAPIGGPATPPTPPDHYGYSFTGWDADISCVTEDMTVNALYAPKKYAVNFTDGHGNIISSQLVTYLTAAVEPEPPYAEPGEIFIGWDADFSCITGDLTVNALWEYVTVCTVTFTGAYTGTVVVNYGEACELPVYPSQYLHYTFMVDGEYWDGECVTSDVTVVVSAAANSIDCTVVFVDWDGTVLSTQTVRYGNPATPPEDPTREGCVFTGWSKNVEFIAHDVTIKAVYAKGPDYLAGDVDCDGLVTMADVTILAMYLNGENPQISVLGMLNADANDEWKVDVRDIAAIYKIITNS